MAQDTNIVVLIGNLTKDPELRHTPSGTAVAKIRLAVNDRVKRDGEWTDTPYYFDVTVWGNQGERCCEWLSKGKKIGVTGRLTWREWESDSGQKRQAVEIVADRVQFLTPRSDGDGGGGNTETRYGNADYSSGSSERAVTTEGGDGTGEGFTPAAETFAGTADDDIPF